MYGHKNDVAFLPHLSSVRFKCPKYYFHPETEKMFKYLAVVRCAVFLGWQQAGLLAGVAFALIRERQQTGWHGGSSHPEELAQQSPFGTFNPAENLAVGEVTSLESITSTIASTG